MSGGLTGFWVLVGTDVAEPGLARVTVISLSSLLKLIGSNGKAQVGGRRAVGTTLALELIRKLTMPCTQMRGDLRPPLFNPPCSGFGRNLRI